MAEYVNTDYALVQRIQAGEIEAFNTIVERYQRRLLGVIMPLIRSRSEAEEVVQEAFIKALRGIRHFRGDCAFYTWMYRITLNCAKYHLGRRRREPSTVLGPELEDWPDFDYLDEHTPEAAFSAKQLVMSIDRALQRMPPLLSTALLLREVDGLCYQEIGEIMGCPVGTVRSRIFRAREFLARLMGGEIGMRRPEAALAIG